MHLNLQNLFKKNFNYLILNYQTFSSTFKIKNNETKTVPTPIKVFDRTTKQMQRDATASQSNFDVFRYLKDEVGYRIADKVYDLTRFNDVCLDLGCGAGHIAPNLIKENIGMLIQCDMSQKMVKISREALNNQFPTLKVVADEELAPFRESSIDLILSSLSAHWINDLPKWFTRCYKILRPDGCLIGALLSGETLYQLRVSLQLAEMERLGGFGAHVSPFVRANDIGSLMNKAGFSMITLDLDEIEIGYPNIFELMYDLKGMGESNATRRRSNNLRRKVLIAANAIYNEMFAKNKRFPATFQFVSFIGWKPGPQFPMPAKRGSQNVSFKDISSITNS